MENYNHITTLTNEQIAILAAQKTISRFQPNSQSASNLVVDAEVIYKWLESKNPVNKNQENKSN